MSASGDKELTWLPFWSSTVEVRKKQGRTQVAGQGPRSRAAPKSLGRTQEAGQDPSCWAGPKKQGRTQIAGRTFKSSGGG
eukprot:scaffold39960_cov18-Tisochrysis_lutea.AAC.3